MTQLLLRGEMIVAAEKDGSMSLVTEFHYTDGDVSAYDDIDVAKLWGEFSRANHEASHILIRPNTEAGQRLSNLLRQAVVGWVDGPEVQRGDLTASLLQETSARRGQPGVTNVLRLSPAAVALVADALLALNPESAPANHFAQTLGHRLKAHN
jgi:hypothetical protein